MSDWAILNDLSAVDGVTACIEGGPGHSYTSKEYTSSAISEGAADFVAAVAFNSTTQSDCRMVPSGSLDWDPTDPDNQWRSSAYSCEGHPDDIGGAEWYSASVPGNDYHGNYCHSGPGGANYNRGVEHDWLRFLWDVTTKEAVTFGGVIDLLAAAEPHSWNAADVGPVADFPARRIEAAFIAAGMGDEWLFWAPHHGTDQ